MTDRYRLAEFAQQAAKLEQVIAKATDTAPTMQLIGKDPAPKMRPKTGYQSLKPPLRAA